MARSSCWHRKSLPSNYLLWHRLRRVKRRAASTLRRRTSEHGNLLPRSRRRLSTKGYHVPASVGQLDPPSAPTAKYYSLSVEATKNLAAAGECKSDFDE
jgi:hypothetical protein